MQLKIPNFSFYLFVSFFNNIITINELMHTASKERMALGMPIINFASEHVLQQSVTESEVAITLHFQLCSTLANDEQ